MDDFGFGPDPDADIQYEQDRLVLDEIERDLGKSYISERVSLSATNKAPINKLNEPSFNIEEEEEKQIELVTNVEDPKRPSNSTRNRKRKRENDNLLNLPNAKRLRTAEITNTHNHNQYDDDEIYLHSGPSLHDTSVKVTNDTDGEQLFIYYSSQSQYDRQIKSSYKEMKNNIRSLNHLGILQQNQSIEELLTEIENERINKQIMEMEDANLDPDQPANIKVAQQLWTDKYAPKLMTDLLSHEQINREVTTWIKQWDYLVFGRKYSRFDAKNKQKEKEAQAKQKKPKKTRLNMFTMFSNNDAVNQRKPHKASINKQRPEVEVVLFCGAAGTGKSTLAHMVANHCGYRAFEINASDERSGKKLKDIIINAATMKPMFGDTRPPLIIMDEIDGAQHSNGDSKSAVDVILKIVKKKEIRKPIICICNNEYSPALRPLRAICKIYKFRAIATRVLCKRLLYVARKEYLHTDLKTLSYLADITNNDIRSCLHTLQFFKERSCANGTKIISSRLTVDTLQKTPIGRKDKTQNIFDIWNKILKKKDKAKNQWKEICAMLFSYGSTNKKIMNGVMENYLKLGYMDPALDITLNTARWIMAYDELTQKIAHKQQFFLMAYVPYVMIGVHETCATDTFGKLQYPSNDYKQAMNYKKNRNIVQLFLTTPYFDIKSGVLELIAYLPFIIFTSKRWNNSDFDQHIKEKEKKYMNFNNKYKQYPSNKKHFVTIIKVMIEYGLDYVASENNFALQPPIEKLSEFSFSEPEFKELAKYANTNQYLREKIAHQITLEIMRRSEAGVHKYIEKGDIKTVKPKKAKPQFTPSAKQLSHQTPIRVNHFISNHNKQAKIEKYEYPVQYRYVEGYTNAVKRKTFFRDWV